MELAIFWAAVFVVQAIFIFVLLILLCCCYRMHRNGQKYGSKQSQLTQGKQIHYFLAESQNREYIQQSSTHHTMQEPTNGQHIKYDFVDRSYPSPTPVVPSSGYDKRPTDEQSKDDLMNRSSSPTPETSIPRKTVPSLEQAAMRLLIPEPRSTSTADTPLATSPSQALWKSSSPIPQMDGVVIHKNIAYGGRERQVVESCAQYTYIPTK